MGLKTVVLSIIIFTGLIYIPIYLVIDHNIQAAKTSYGIDKLTQQRLHRTKSNIEIISIKYKKYPNYNTTIIAKNTGSYPLEPNKTIIYINGTRYKNNISRHISNLKNPMLWDPGEYINITLDEKIKTQANYLISLSSQYGVKKEKKLYNQINPLLFQSYINPIDGNENTSIYNRSFAIYNPNDETIYVWNVTDEFSKNNIILSQCNPSPCSLSGNRIIYSGNYSIGRESYRIFWYRANINGSDNGIINTTYYAHKFNRSDIAPYSTKIGSATARITINGDIAIERYKGKNDFSIKIEETTGKAPLTTSQYLSIRIPEKIVSISSTDPNVAINSTHITYKIKNPIISSSETFSFNGEMPDYHMPLIFNATLNGSSHNDSVELLVITEGEAPVIGSANANRTTMSVGENVTFSQSITDSSGVQDVYFNISNNWYRANEDSGVYKYNLTCTSPKTYIWNMTNASDIRGYINSTRFEEINVTCS